MEEEIQLLYGPAFDLFGLKSEEFFNFYLFYTIVPFWSIAYLSVTWGVQNFSLISAFVVDHFQLLGIDFTNKELQVEWGRWYYISACQIAIFFLEVLITLISFVPLLNLPINLSLLGFVLLLSWQIRVTLEQGIVVPF